MAKKSKISSASEAKRSDANTAPKRGYPDLHEHLEALERAGLLITVDRPIDKDTEMHPLVRWQFRGGIEEPDRKAFLFTRVTDAQRRKYEIPVAGGALAGRGSTPRGRRGGGAARSCPPQWSSAHRRAWRLPRRRKCPKRWTSCTWPEGSSARRSTS